MSQNQDKVSLLLNRLNKCAESISHAYQHGRVERTEDNRNQIEMLRQMRVLSPDVRDAFQLRSSIRQFLDAVLNTERLLKVGADLGANFEQLTELVDLHSSALLDSRNADCERYEIEIRDSISDIADAIEDDLVMLNTLVANKFAAVSTVAEKKRQNLYYQKRTQRLVDLLESFHFSDITHRLSGNQDLALTFRVLLSDRIPEFRASLSDILEQLNAYLFEFRRVEERAKRVRGFWLHLNRNPGWSPRDWSEVAEPQVWLQIATPLQLSFHPDVLAPNCEHELVALAKKIPAEAMLEQGKKSRPLGYVGNVEPEQEIKVPKSPLQLAIRAYFKEASKSVGGMSACRWWALHPQEVGNIRQDIWLMRVLTEHDKRGREGSWILDLAEMPGEFSGNVMISDVFVSRRHSHV
ncbi:MAG: hypothetical protein ACXW11_03435 [Methylotenera sp.]